MRAVVSVAMVLSLAFLASVAIAHRVSPLSLSALHPLSSSPAFLAVAEDPTPLACIATNAKAIADAEEANKQAIEEAKKNKKKPPKPIDRFPGCFPQAVVSKPGSVGTPKPDPAIDTVAAYDSSKQYLELDSHNNPFGDPLPSGAGVGPNVILRWSKQAVDVSVTTLDVYIHLHGNSGTSANGKLTRDKDGLQHPQPDATNRAILWVTVRGRYCSTGKAGNTFQWQDLHNAEGMNCFIDWCLANFANVARSDKKPPAKGRFILSAHSGGGLSLNSIVTYPKIADQPNELYLQDCLYFGITQVVAWVKAHAAVDAPNVDGKSCADQRPIMKTGSPLRCVYFDTKGGSKALDAELGKLFGNKKKPKTGGFFELAQWYRVDAAPGGWNHDACALTGSVFLQEVTNALKARKNTDFDVADLTSGSGLPQPC